MKKIVALALSIASIGFSTSVVNAKSAGASSSPVITVASSAPAPQWRNQDRWGRRNNHRRARVYVQSRLVRYGRAIFRETYQIRVMPNGRTITRLISRVRVR